MESMPPTVLPMPPARASACARGLLLLFNMEPVKSARKKDVGYGNNSPTLSIGNPNLPTCIRVRTSSSGAVAVAATTREQEPPIRGATMGPAPRAWKASRRES